MLRQTLIRVALHPEAQTYLAELPDLQVVGICGCGCGSLYFQPDPGNRLIADGWADFANGKEANVMLWTHDGRLSYLEIVDWEEAGGLPDPKTIRTHEERWP